MGHGLEGFETGGYLYDVGLNVSEFMFDEVGSCLGSSGEGLGLVDGGVGLLDEVGQFVDCFLERGDLLLEGFDGSVIGGGGIIDVSLLWQ